MVSYYGDGDFPWKDVVDIFVLTGLQVLQHTACLQAGAWSLRKVFSVAVFDDDKITPDGLNLCFKYENGMIFGLQLQQCFHSITAGIRLYVQSLMKVVCD